MRRATFPRPGQQSLGLLLGVAKLLNSTGVLIGVVASGESGTDLVRVDCMGPGPTPVDRSSVPRGGGLHSFYGKGARALGRAGQLSPAAPFYVVNRIVSATIESAIAAYPAIAIQSCRSAIPGTLSARAPNTLTYIKL
jgi:hypothetical protein